LLQFIKHTGTNRIAVFSLVLFTIYIVAVVVYKNTMDGATQSHTISTPTAGTQHVR